MDRNDRRRHASNRFGVGDGGLADNNVTFRQIAWWETSHRRGHAVAPRRRHGVPGGHSLVLLALVLGSCRAAAHVTGDESAPAPPRWSFEPWVAVCLVSGAVLYVAGLARLWQRSGGTCGIRAW